MLTVTLIGQIVEIVVSKNSLAGHLLLFVQVIHCSPCDSSSSIETPATLSASRWNTKWFQDSPWAN